MLTWKSPNCSRNYQRITELEQEEEQKDDVCSSCHAPAARAKRTAGVDASQNEDPDSDEEDVKGLVRVRLITANPRHPALDPGQSRPLQGEPSAALPSLPPSSKTPQDNKIPPPRLLNTRHELAKTNTDAHSNPRRDHKRRKIDPGHRRIANWYCCLCGVRQGGLLINPNNKWSRRCEVANCGHLVCSSCVLAD